ncbi:MAG TPA: hypothetical protein VLK22_00625 [Candidatus Udaeobacter sp.]|nr:hypothetical protein [Candidatus Udaeobacter sp.]
MTVGNNDKMEEYKMGNEQISSNFAVKARPAVEQRIDQKKYTKTEGGLARAGHILVFLGVLALVGGFLYGSFIFDPFVSRFSREKLEWIGHVVIPAITIGLICVGGVLIWLAGCKRNRRLNSL